MSGPTEDMVRPSEGGRFPRDFLTGLAMLGFCAVAWVASLTIADAPAALAQNVQPGTFPRGVIAVIAVLSVAMMAVGLGHPEPGRKLPKLVMIATAALMVAFVIAFEALGLLAAIFVFCMLLPVLWGERFSLRLVGYAIAFPLAVYVVFDTLLGVYFPPGIVETFLKSLT